MMMTVQVPLIDAQARALNYRDRHSTCNIDLAFVIIFTRIAVIIYTSLPSLMVRNRSSILILLGLEGGME